MKKSTIMFVVLFLMAQFGIASDYRIKIDSKNDHNLIVTVAAMTFMQVLGISSNQQPSFKAPTLDNFCQNSTLHKVKKGTFLKKENLHKNHNNRLYDKRKVFRSTSNNYTVTPKR